MALLTVAARDSPLLGTVDRLSQYLAPLDRRQAYLLLLLSSTNEVSVGLQGSR